MQRDSSTAPQGEQPSKVRGDKKNWHHVCVFALTSCALLLALSHIPTIWCSSLVSCMPLLITSITTSRRNIATFTMSPFQLRHTRPWQHEAHTHRHGNPISFQVGVPTLIAFCMFVSRVAPETMPQSVRQRQGQTVSTMSRMVGWEGHVSVAMKTGWLKQHSSALAFIAACVCLLELFVL